MVAAFEVLQQLWLEIQHCCCWCYGTRSSRQSSRVRDDSGAISIMEGGNRQCSAGKARALVTGEIDTNLLREGLCKDWVWLPSVSNVPPLLIHV